MESLTVERAKKKLGVSELTIQDLERLTAADLINADVDLAELALNLSAKEVDKCCEEFLQIGDEDVTNVNLEETVGTIGMLHLNMIVQAVIRSILPDGIFTSVMNKEITPVVQSSVMKAYIMGYLSGQKASKEK